jgi:CRP-like cAMP-binding protein
VQLDRSRTGRRNLLLTGLPAADLALLAPHLKDVVLEQGTVLQEQGEPIDQVPGGRSISPMMESSRSWR